MPTSAEAVKPLDWQRAVIRDPDIVSTPVVAIAACLVTIAPGRPRRGCWDFYASAVTLADLSHLSERAVRDALAVLRGRGYLCQVKRGGNRNRGRAHASEWRLTMPGEPADGAASLFDIDQSEAADGAVSLPVDNSPERGVNRHEHASEPAPPAAQERVYTKSGMASVGLLRTEGPLVEFATDADADVENDTVAALPPDIEWDAEFDAAWDSFCAAEGSSSPNYDQFATRHAARNGDAA